MADKQEFYVELESIRGLMAWWVVCGHLYSTFHQAIAPLPLIIEKFLLATAIPVDIFICLSGFFISKALDKNNSTYGPYIIRRAFRIIPTYFFAMSLAIVFFDVRMSTRVDIPWSTAVQVAAVEDYWHGIASSLTTYLLPCLVLLQGMIPDQLLPNSGSAFLAPAWSLTLEWQFYLIAPLLSSVFLFRWGKQLVVTVSLVSLLLLTSSGLTFSYGAFILVKLPVFILGMFTHNLFSNKRSKQKTVMMMLLVALSVGLITMSFSSFISIALWCFFAISFSLRSKYKESLVLSLLNCCKLMLSNRVFIRLGVLSYSTYMIHILVIDFILVAAKRVGFLHSDFVGLLIVLSVIVTYFVSVMMNRFIEVPFINYGKKIVSTVYSREIKC